MIDFELDGGQLELQSSARRLFTEAAGLPLARRLLEEGGGFSRDLWRTMVGLDWAGLAVPVAYGGSGGGLLDLYALSVETGRALAVSPLIPSSVVAAHTLASADPGDSPAGSLLRRIASGDAIVIPAVLESSGVWDVRGVETILDQRDDHLSLQGTKVLVPFADVATSFLVAARHDGGVSLVLVDPLASGVTVTPVDNLAALPLSTVRFDDVTVATDAIVGAPGAGWALIEPAIARGAVLRAAEIAGAGEHMLELAVDYAKQRNQFGKPIGSYQAVQYLCTDIGIESHLTALLARRAAWLIDTGAPAHTATAAAKFYASRAAAHMTQQAHEVFAGLAFMMEHDLHLITRHAKHWEFDLGDQRYHSEQLVKSLESSVNEG